MTVPPWVSNAACRNLPADWWDTGDEGNRLAMMLCDRACPVRDLCAMAEVRPAGVIRGGVPFSDRGARLAVCGCGRPVVRVTADNPKCRVCDPVAPKALWVRAYWRERASGRRSMLRAAA